MAHVLPDQEITPEFRRMWQGAGRHLQEQAADRFMWLKADLFCPMIEHLSFRLGNLLVFVQLVDLNDRVHGPGSQQGLLTKAEEAGAVPCLMPMQCWPDGTWSAVFSGWGLLAVGTAAPFDPLQNLSSQPVELTDWEIHDFAIQVVRNHVVEQGRQLMGYCSDLNVDPSLWFIGDEGPEWVVIRGLRHPATNPSRWPDLDKIAASSRPLATGGNTAVVRFEHVDQQSAALDRALPILRGEPVEADFAGLVRV